MSTTSSAGSAIWSHWVNQVLVASTAAFCLGLLAFKFFLIWRLNINWDEFYYLSFVHTAARGELELLLQTAHTHLFEWLTKLAGGEMVQIGAARVVMTCLLGATVVLIWRMSRQWLYGMAAMVPPLVYISSVPVMIHGGSFRSDSMLAPITMAALLLLTAERRGTNKEVLAGILLGIAFAITVKVILFAPLVAAILLARPSDGSLESDAPRRAVAPTIGKVCCSALITAALLVFLHSLTITSVPTESVLDFGARTASKTLLEVPLFPRLDYLQRYIIWQPLSWLLIAFGGLIALAQRRFDVAALSLSLLPVVFYRNAFPYYYVVMLAPASILAGLAFQETRSFVGRRFGAFPAILLSLLMWFGLLQQGAKSAAWLHDDGQWVQRQILSGVRHIFPDPVNYIDRCGMVASYRKVGFFMSTWGLESYRKRGLPFMPDLIRDSEPAFVLVNTAALEPGRSVLGGLLPEDLALIAQFYPRYWGPIRVAGASVEVSATEDAWLRVPFAAEYRLSSSDPVLINGHLRHPGDVFDVPAEGIAARFPTQATPSDYTVTVFLSVARTPPDVDFPELPIFESL